MSWVDIVVLVLLVVVFFVELARASNNGFAIAMLDAVGLILVKVPINRLAHWMTDQWNWADAKAYGASWLLISLLVLVAAHFAQNLLGWSFDETLDSIVGFFFAILTAVALAHGLLQLLVLIYPEGTATHHLIQNSWLAQQCLYYKALGQFGDAMRNLGSF